MIAMPIRHVPSPTSIDQHLEIDMLGHVGIKPLNKAIEDDHHISDFFNRLSVIVINRELHDQLGHFLICASSNGNVATDFTEGFSDPFVDGCLCLSHAALSRFMNAG